MKLILRKFDNSETKISISANLTNDMIYDIVVGAELGFVYNKNGKEFYNYHTFGFHYCLDVYKNEKNISFNILSPNEDTQEYCFWKYSQNFYDEKLKSRKFEIDNSQISVNKVENGFTILELEQFESVIEKLKKDLWNTHEKILEKFNKEKIKYDENEMKRFSNKLKDFINESYSCIRQSELRDLINKYDAMSLSYILSEKENINIKNRKIKI